MNRITIGSMLLLLAPTILAAPAYPETHWYDLDNCAYCRNLTRDQQLLDHVTWESHLISDGALTVTVVAPAFEDSYHQAQAAMAELARKVKSGEIDPTSMKVCGRCEAYGRLVTSGVTTETVVGEQAEITLVTADSPELVARIHEFVKRNIAEMEHMKHGHGHQHHP